MSDGQNAEEAENAIYTALMEVFGFHFDGEKFKDIKELILPESLVEKNDDLEPHLSRALKSIWKEDHSMFCMYLTHLLKHRKKMQKKLGSLKGDALVILSDKMIDILKTLPERDLSPGAKERVKNIKRDFKQYFKKSIMPEEPLVTRGGKFGISFLKAAEQYESTDRDCEDKKMIKECALSTKKRWAQFNRDYGDMRPIGEGKLRALLYDYADMADFVLQREKGINLSKNFLIKIFEEYGEPCKTIQSK
ncbi:MAG: hypothetical protein JW808_08000 [Victivallales bacterium]|nr:hypothetical protein [Victivallales bacterium]